MEWKLHEWKLHHYIFELTSILIFVLYFGMAWYWQWFYYFKQHDRSEEWKCQPKKFLKPTHETHEIFLGTFNMLLGSITSGITASYIINGGNSKIYYTVSEYGWFYFFGSFVVFFMYCESLGYYLHRLAHFPLFYKHLHKWHHRYHQPTAFAATAMHPVEFIFYQLYIGLVPFVVPIHFGVFVCVLFYNYYYGMCDHSGVKMKAFWPWQPDTTFHDNHHRYFHVNFGINLYLFDWLHGTLKQENRLYGENIYGGYGKPNPEKVQENMEY